MSYQFVLYSRRVMLLVVGLLLLSYAPAGAYPALMKQLKKAVVFLGQFDQVDGKGQLNIHGTGCLIEVEGVFHLLTAKHVLFSDSILNKNLEIFLNRHNGGVQYRKILTPKQENRVDWVFHPNSNVDLAIIPIALDPKTDDFMTIPQSLFFDSMPLHELYDVFFLSHQPGVELGGKINPVIRKGMISRINSDGTILIDGSAFPGNSGSPVFLTPSPMRYDEQGNTIKTIGDDGIDGRFVGIITSYVPYQEVAISMQTKRPRVIFEENTGLSTVFPVKLILELLNSESFQKQLAAIKAM
jgi:hypothetical protein